MNYARKNYNPTFPRSGHRWMRNMVKSYYGKEFHFCATHKDCRQVPCIDPGTNWQKTHDFLLNDVIDSDYRYVIQVRNPLDSITSWYEFDLEHKVDFKDSKENWDKYIIEKITLWLGFVYKYCVRHNNINMIIVKYSDLVINTASTLEKVIRFTAGTESVDKNLISQSITEPHSIRNIYDFRYYDYEYFKYVEDSVSIVLDYLEIDRKFS